MRIFISSFVLLLATTIGFAADQEPEKNAKDTRVQKSAEPETVKKQKTPTWPRPYKLTEEISVDSVVPFPTDI